MKRILFILAACVFSLNCLSCGNDPVEEPVVTPPDSGQQGEGTGGEENSGNGDNNTENNNNGNNDEQMNRNIIISIGDRNFSATMDDNEAARAFIALLPMTVDMTEMNGNEKYYNLSQNLPTNTFRPGTIHAGDLLLWGSSTVVLFYETFSSGYSYTRLGRITNPEGLASAVGRGNVRVTFSIQKAD